MDSLEKFSNVAARTMVSELVYRSCMALDARDFPAFLNLCDEKFHYRISAFSPEIKKEMTWLEHDMAGMQLLFKKSTETQ